MGGIGDLIVWREAALLVVRVEEAAEVLKGPAPAVVAEQMVRAANSITSNIAEGYGRGVTRDGMRFFRFAHSSTDELESQLRLILMKGRLSREHAESLISHTRRVGYLIHRYELSIERRLA